MLERFKLRENGTNVRTEIRAGVTTFVTMAYIIFVNPSILSTTGMDAGAVMIATCLAAAVGTAIMGLLSNYPFAQASGMGLNAFFAFTICGSMGYSWKGALACVFVSGILFIIVTITGAREAIVRALPDVLKKAIGVGIGLFIAYIGIKNCGLLSFTVDPGNYTLLGETVVTNSSPVPAISISTATTILAIIGLIIMIVLVVKKVKGALLIGIIATSIIGAIMQFGFNVSEIGMTLPTKFEVSSLAPTFGAFLGGFAEIFSAKGILTSLLVFLMLFIVDFFDSTGTFIATADKIGALDKDGNLPRAKQAYLADAIGTTVGAILGTSTVTTYVESTAGIAEGGRTGLTSVVTAILFGLAVFLSPLLGLIPGAATAPVLIVVGVMMMGSVLRIKWNDISEAIPAFLTIAVMPFMYSIAEGIAWGILSYVIVKLAKKEAGKIHPAMYILCILFIVRYIALNVI